MASITPIIFFGTEDFSAVSLQKLIDEKFYIVGIITKPDSKKGRGQKMHAPIVKKIGLNCNIPVLQPQKMTEITAFVQQFKNPCGVLVSFGKIIPQKIIDLFTPGIVNLHPSLLPRYRGPSPIEAAISRGDAETGISIMKLSAKMDAGPIYTQKIIKLDKPISAKSLYKKAGEIGADLLTQTLPEIIKNGIISTPQNDDNAVYCNLLAKEDSILNPTEQTAKQAERQIRAYEIYPKTKINFGEYLCIIESAEFSPTANNEPLAVKFKDGNYLIIQKLTAPNGKRMDAVSFHNGYLK